MTPAPRAIRDAARHALYVFVAIALWAGAIAIQADPAKAPAKPSPVKPDKSAVKASDAALRLALEALKKEVLAHAGDAKTPLRAKCNYFTLNPPKDPVLPEEIVEALDEAYSSDPPSDSYVKWQLLSGAPRKLDGELAHFAAIAYLNAGKPLPRPGLSAADKRELDALAKDVRTAEEAAALTQKLASLIKPWEERNMPVLEYRDELYARLPRNGEALVARLEDDAQRVEAGYESEREMKVTTDAIDEWIDTKPPAHHLQVLAVRTATWMDRRGEKDTKASTYYGKWAKLIVKYGKRNAGEPPAFPPTYYENVEFVPDGYEVINQPRARAAGTAGQWKWRAAAARQIDPEVLSDLNVTLEHYAERARAEEAMKK